MILETKVHEFEFCFDPFDYAKWQRLVRCPVKAKRFASLLAFARKLCCNENIFHLELQKLKNVKYEKHDLRLLVM